MSKCDKPIEAGLKKYFFFTYTYHFLKTCRYSVHANIKDGGSVIYEYVFKNPYGISSPSDQARPNFKSEWTGCSRVSPRPDHLKVEAHEVSKNKAHRKICLFFVFFFFFPNYLVCHKIKINGGWHIFFLVMGYSH